MAQFTKTNVSYRAAKVSLAQFIPESDKALNIPARTVVLENDWTPAAIAYLEANYPFQIMAWFKNFKISDTFENEVTDEVDDCLVQERQKKADIRVIITGDWLTTLDLEITKILLWYDFFSDPWAEVIGEAYTLPANGFVHDKTYRLPYQNHDTNGKIIKPTTYSATAWGSTIVDGTDYEIIENSFGEYQLVIKSTVALIDEVVLTYNHIPVTADYGWYKADTVVQPYFVVKVETCPDEDGRIHFYYVTKCSLSWTLDTNFISKWEVPLSSITFNQWLWGDKYFKKQK